MSIKKLLTIINLKIATKNFVANNSQKGVKMHFNNDYLLIDRLFLFSSLFFMNIHHFWFDWLHWIGVRERFKVDALISLKGLLLKKHISTTA